jgi:hypothetical protein
MIGTRLMGYLHPTDISEGDVTLHGKALTFFGNARTCAPVLDLVSRYQVRRGTLPCGKMLVVSMLVSVPYDHRSFRFDSLTKETRNEPITFTRGNGDFVDGCTFRRCTTGIRHQNGQ